jgi:predicted aldo/keto reductase-like oxidoreductase
LSYGWGSSQKVIANFAEQIGGRQKLWLTSKSKAWIIKGLEEDIDECLSELKTDYLHLYQKHMLSDPDDINKEFISIGDRLKKSGKMRFFGFSCQGCSHFCENAVQGEARIADSLRFLVYYECFGKKERAKELYKEIPNNKRVLTQQQYQIA